MEINKRFIEKLRERHALQILRELPGVQVGADFLSNDYLGLARSKELASAIQQGYDKINEVQNGATGSRLLSGNSKYVAELEAFLAGYFNAESTLVFNSGYTANLALLATVPQRGDTILLDEYAHACMKEGARLSFADKKTFRHNDLSDLKKKLNNSNGQCFVVVESVYSMDGDECPLAELVSLCRSFPAYLIIDEAHSTGVLGKHGSGLACQLGLESEVFARVFTFGKAMGVHGACVAGSGLLVRYLVNFARSFIYTTALPNHSIVAMCEAFKFLKRKPMLQAQLKDVIGYFKAQAVPDFQAAGIAVLPSESAIQALIIPGVARIKKVAESIQDQGFVVRPILSPTVKAGAERLRICLHSYNTKEEIDGLKTVIISSLKNCI